MHHGPFGNIMAAFQHVGSFSRFFSPLFNGMARGGNVLIGTLGIYGDVYGFNARVLSMELFQKVGRKRFTNSSHNAA